MTVTEPLKLRVVGFVGLGRMGEPMARRLADSEEVHVLVHDTAPGLAVQIAATSGAEQANSLSDLAKRSDAVITMLPSSSAVREVILGRQDEHSSDHLTSGSRPQLLIDMGSSDPGLTRRLAAELAPLGTTLLDAPVSGGVGGAKRGDLTIMIGGDQADVEICQPLLERLGDRVEPTGPVGSAHAMKALNNLLSAIGLIGALEVLQAGSAFGLEPHTMLNILNGSSGRNFATETKIAPFVLSRSFSSGFTLDLLAKDTATALALDKKNSDAPSLSHVANQVCKRALDDLGPRHDHTEIARWLETVTEGHLG